MNQAACEAAPFRAGVLLFPQVEPLDFAGPYEVLACARDGHSRAYCQALTIAERPEVVCHGGLRVRADHGLDDAPPLDILVVPGGPGAREPVGDLDPVLRFLRAQACQAQVLASVCTGSYWLARAGLLDGCSATTHSLRLDDFAARFPAVQVVREKVVDLGRIITAGGVASGIDLALHLLARFFGSEARRREAARLDGPWR
ncbi:MAG: DJ-1/PfpI family protein [Thermodesulfobacteriota bacterium]